MVQELAKGLLLTSLQIFEGENGRVLHALKKNEKSFSEFGEAYFSTVLTGAFKGWKKHKEMYLNITVPVGKIRFYIVDEREGKENQPFTFTIELSTENYHRLTIPPGIWFGFEGVGSGTNMLLNISSIPHDPADVETESVSKFSNHFPALAESLF